MGYHHFLTADKTGDQLINIGTPRKPGLLLICGRHQEKKRLIGRLVADDSRNLRLLIIEFPPKAYKTEQAGAKEPGCAWDRNSGCFNF
jgi:hypothetical protein